MTDEHKIETNDEVLEMPPQNQMYDDFNFNSRRISKDESDLMLTMQKDLIKASKP